ncbi:MAG: transcription antitermination factor NusB [Clostridiales bacterium]|nr:transcription antitermination factor NusB [Clostridiales bacterium]
MRSLARETAFKIIYMSLFTGNEISCEELMQEDGITEEQDKDYEQDKQFVTALVSMYAENKETINSLINSKLVGYVPERVYRIDRAILALALTEIKFYKQTPQKVVINEAIEMAKKYSTEKSYSFVNGILKALLEENNGI